MRRHLSPRSSIPSLVLYRHSFRAMACDNEIHLYATDERQSAAAANAAIGEVKRIEAKYSRYVDDSVVSTINRAAGGRPTMLDSETISLLNYAHTCYQQSEGLFDISSGVLRRVWNFKASEVPSSASIDAVLSLVGWDKVERDADSIRLPRAGMEIDFGGFGKEYAVDRAAFALASYGIANAMINLGGDMMVLGPHADGRPWGVGIRHPRADDATLTTVACSSGAIATSGDYERFIEVDGRRYCHILNPKTGWPVENVFQSVTVHAPTCLVAGSATTIAMLKGKTAGLAWLEALGLPYLAVDSGGRKAGHQGASFSPDRSST